MKAVLWRRAAMRYLAPELPGEWHAAGQVLYRQPSDEWLLCGLLEQTSSYSSNFWVEAFVRLLPKPAVGWAGNIRHRFGERTGRGLWPGPTTVADSESVMREIAAAARAEAIPFFDTVGTLDGYAVEVTGHVEANPLNVHLQEELAYVHLLRADLPAARVAADAVVSSTDPRPWVEEIRQRVSTVMAAAGHSRDEAIGLLRDQADATRVQLKLPRQ